MMMKKSLCDKRMMERKTSKEKYIIAISLHGAKNSTFYLFSEIRSFSYKKSLYI